MSINLPKDTNSRVIGAKARAVVHKLFDAEYWEYHEATGQDVGIDCYFDLVENNEVTPYGIDCQVKGRTKPTFVEGGTSISISLKTGTVGHAIKRSRPFILLLVQIEPEITFFLELHEHFSMHPDLIKKLAEQMTVSLRIPVSNVIRDSGRELIDLAKKQFKYSKGIVTSIN